MDEIPSRAVFTEHLGDTFRIKLDADQSLNVTLIEVKLLKAYAGQPRQDPMSLLFRGPHNAFLPQSAYTLEHELLGAVTLVLVPIVPDANGTYFEAVIN